MFGRKDKKKLLELTFLFSEVLEELQDFGGENVVEYQKELEKIVN